MDSSGAIYTTKQNTSFHLEKTAMSSINLYIVCDSTYEMLSLAGASWPKRQQVNGLLQTYWPR